jgi:hypothetical protein
VKNLLSVIAVVLLLVVFSVASSDPDWDHHGNQHKKYGAPEPGVISMLVLSLGTISGGLISKSRRRNKAPV